MINIKAKDIRTILDLLFQYNKSHKLNGHIFMNFNGYNVFTENSYMLSIYDILLNILSRSSTSVYDNNIFHNFHNNISESFQIHMNNIYKFNLYMLFLKDIQYNY